MTIAIKPTASGSTIEQNGSTILTVDGSGNISAANNFSATGHVVQVQSATTTTNTTVSTNTYTDVSGLSVAITPKSSSNKILVMVTLHGYYNLTAGTNEHYAGIKLLRNSTDIFTPPDGSGNPYGIGHYQAGTAVDQAFQIQQTYTYLDSPATTSATTYKVQVRPYNSSWGNVQINRGSNSMSTITVMEVAG